MDTIGFGLDLGELVAATSSAAMMMLANETQGLALDFTAGGLDGSAAIKDTTTPANNYDNAPTLTASSLLTYTSPSNKLVMGPTGGLLRYPAHNLYLNSAAPANQSITVVSGATYAVTITGSVSVTASGAATGTWTAGTQTFTAATGTLTFGSTTGSGTVHVRRTPSNSTYLATTSAARYALPIEFNSSGVSQGLLVEEARTNLLLRSQEIGGPSWSATTTTVTTNNATAPDGTLTASKLEATGGDSFVNQSVTASAATAYTLSVWLRSDVATSVDIYLIDSGGGSGFTNTVCSVTPAWQRFTVTRTTSSGTTSLIGYVGGGSSFTSGETVYAWGGQLEVGSFPTSYIQTFASTVTRAADNISLATSAFPTANAFTLFAQGYTINPLATRRMLVEMAGTFATNTVGLTFDSSNDSEALIYSGGAPTVLTVAADIQPNEVHKLAVGAETDNLGLALDGTLSGSSATGSSPAAANISSLVLGSGWSDLFPFNGVLQKVLVVPRRMSNAELQTLTT